MPTTGAKDSLRYVFILDSELVIPKTKVYLREGPRSSELIEELVYPGQRVMIFDYYVAQFPIIYAQPQGSILLFCEQYWGSP